MQRTLTILIAALLVTTAAVPAATVAQSDDEEKPFFDGLISDDGAEGFLNLPDITATVSKLTSSGDRIFTKYTTDGEQASSYANATAEVFNANNATILDYANARLNATTDVDTLAIEFSDRDGGTATRYLVADVADGNYTSAEMVTSTAFNDTNRTVDYRIEADWYVSQHASDELEMFVEDYAEPGKNLTTTEQARLVSKYSGGLSSGLWGEAL